MNEGFVYQGERAVPPTEWVRVRLTLRSKNSEYPITSRTILLAMFPILANKIRFAPLQRGPEGELVIARESLRVFEGTSIYAEFVGDEFDVLGPPVEGTADVFEDNNPKTETVTGDQHVYMAPRTYAYEGPTRVAETRNAKTREELARSLSEMRKRIGGIVPADMDDGNLKVGKDGNIRVEKIKRRKRGKDPAEQLAEKMKAVLPTKYSVGIEEKIVDVLLKKSKTLTGQLTQDVASLKVKQLQLNEDLARAAEAFQLEKFWNSCGESLMKRLKREAPDRKLTFKKLGSLLSVDAAKLETEFLSVAEDQMKTLAGKVSARETLEKVISDLVTTSATLEAKALSLSNIGTEWREGLTEKVRDHLRRISEADFVHSISFAGTVLTVTVGPSVIKYNSRKYYVGDFEIRLDLDKAEKKVYYGITFYNTVIAQASQFHFPHIMDYGTGICWGSASKSAFNLFGEWNWTVLIGFLWHYLTSYNPNSNHQCLEEVSKVAVREAQKKGIKIPDGCVLDVPRY